MDEIISKLNIQYGFVEIQSRYRDLNGWLVSESRRIERDQYGGLVMCTGWQETGGRMKLGQDATATGASPNAKSWWEFWK